MGDADQQHIRELEARCLLLEQAFLIQEKRVWSQDMLQQLERGEFLPNADANEKAQTRKLLLGNLRVSREVLDHLALELGYDTTSIRKLLDPEFAYGAPGDDIPDQLVEQLEALDARERESGDSHLRAMFRDLKTRHDEFLSDVQRKVRDDVQLNDLFETLAVE